MSDTQESSHLSNQAKLLHFQGLSIKQISEQLNVPYGTADSWKRRGQWEKISPTEIIVQSVDERLTALIFKVNKSDREFKEIELLMSVREKNAKMLKYEQSKKESDLNPNLKKRAEGRAKAKERNNLLGDEVVEALNDAFLKQMFPHQKAWHDALCHPIRFILKSRQIGATYYFAHEAIIDAMNTGKNKVFISASKNQARVFRRNIINFVRDVTGIELKGDPIILPHNGAELHFLGTNKDTVQSYSGDLYIDECFWIRNFTEIENVASGMTVLDDRRITYFSTPSSTSHQAYQLWSGQQYNKERPKKQHILIDVSHRKLKDGNLGADGIWRQIMTIEDTVKLGYNLVTLDKLRQKFPPVKYKHLLMCEFVDDEYSIFKMSELQTCMVDTIERWKDFNPLISRPYGNHPVWIGYDPSDTLDHSSLVVLAPPRISNGKFRILERHSWQGMDFDNQARQIENMIKRYNVQHIGIDATGLGIGLFQLVQRFYPKAMRIKYDVEVKTNLVLKAKQVIQNHRLEFDSEMTDIAMAFMTIYQTATNGGVITYKARRTETTGHGDVAWAMMHAMAKESLSGIDELGNAAHSIIESF